jgi:predicted SprT family Zn-dependent metalloprotease
MNNIYAMVAQAFNAIINNPASTDSIKNAAIKAQAMLKVVINPRLRVAAGRARARLDIVTRRPSYVEIELNPSLFNRINDAEQYNTVSHEVAHVVDYFIRGDSGHDYFWQNLHHLAGGTGEQFHKYDVTGLRNNVKRIILLDTITSRELKVTVQTFNKVRFNARYKHLRTEIYQGKTLMASHSAHP